MPSTLAFWSTAVAVVLTATACATSYKPRPSPRVALVMKDGAPALEKNGQLDKIGPFGGGLVDAVQGHAEAEDHARTYRGLMVGGFVTNLLGAATAAGGVGVLAYNEAKDSPSAGLRAASFGMMFGGLGVALAGTILMASAQPHFYDAINLYNDSVAAPPVYVPVVPVAPGPQAVPLQPPPSPQPLPTPLPAQ
jgi:hypothetical protein